MIKELEKVMIEDVEYSFNPEKEYIKDGHAYCKVCHERKDGKALEFFGKQMIFKTACKCDRDRLSLIHISEPTRPCGTSRMPSSA